MTVYGTILGNAVTAKNSFAKADHSIVAFTKTGAFTASTATEIILEIGGNYVVVDSGTAITMPSPTTGTDYIVWVTPAGIIQATNDAINPPVTGAKKVGGFHYAPGSNATAQSGGDTTPQINPYSFWDLKFRPTCADPRGMTLVNNTFWCDIYLTGVDAITNGSSKYNVTIADGSSPPKIPTMFGGNGSATYGSYTWFEAMELSGYFGKRNMSYSEFVVAAFGTTEATNSGGSDVPTTGISGTGATSAWNVFTSKWGLIQAAGCMWIWGLDRTGPYNTGGWNANTESRGSEYNAPNVSLFGGSWVDGSYSGSRCSLWDYAASNSYNFIGSRFACDHLVLGS